MASDPIALAPSVPPTADRFSGLLLAVAGAVAFSGKAIIIKLAYRHGVDAVTMLMYRMLFALPFFIGMAWWSARGRPALSTRDRLALLAIGFMGYYLASFLDFLGLQYISAGLERLILYLNPTLVLLLAWGLYGRRASRQQWLALAVSYAGVLLVFAQEAHFAGPHVAWGAALVFGSALCYAVYLVYSGQVLRRIGALRLTGGASTVACVLCLAQFALLRPLTAAAVPEPVLWLSLLNATLCTVVPVLLVMLAVERVGPALAAQAGSVGPLSTVLLSVWLLGEAFTPGLAAGTACVLVGVWMLARSR